MVGTPLLLQSKVSYLQPSSYSLIRVFFSFCRGAEIVAVVQPPTDLVTLAICIHHLLFQLLVNSSLLIYYSSLHFGDLNVKITLAVYFSLRLRSLLIWLHVGLSINITYAVSSNLENSCRSLLHLDIRCFHICFTGVLRSTQIPCDFIVALSTEPMHLI